MTYVYSTKNWKIVSYVQIAFYVLIAIVDVFVILRFISARRNRNTSWGKGVNNIFKFYLIYFSLFIVFKIAGGVCAAILFHQDTFPLGLTIATFIFDSISLGILIKSVLPLIEYFLDLRSDIVTGTVNLEEEYKLTEEGEAYERPEKGRYHPFKILTLILMGAVICSIVASSEMSSSPSTYKTCIKISAILFLVVVLIVTAILFFTISFFSSSAYPHASIITQQAIILLIACPFLLIRVIYSILSAFSNSNIASSTPGKFTLLFGDYVYYTFLGFIEECIIALIIIFSVFYFINNVNHMHG